MKNIIFSIGISICFFKSVVNAEGLDTDTINITREQVSKHIIKLQGGRLGKLLDYAGKPKSEGVLNCLCRATGRGGVGGGVHYKPGYPCEAIGVLGGHSGPIAFPSDPGSLNNCHYDDDSTIVDVVEKALHSPKISKADVEIPKEPKIEVFEPCWNAVALNHWLSELKDIRLDIKAKIVTLDRERENYVDLREKAYAEAKPNSPVAKYWEALAEQQRENLQAALKTSLALKDAALRKAMGEFTRTFSSYMSEQKDRNLQGLSNRVASRRQLVSDNKGKLAKYDSKLGQLKQKIDGWSASTPKESSKIYKEFKSLEANRQILNNKINASEKVIKQIDGVLANPQLFPGQKLEKIAELKDAILGQEKAVGNQKDQFWAEQTALNDHAHRVAEQLFLGMDRRVAVSMNPDAILAELSPAIKAKMMHDKAETYKEMIEGLNEMLPNTIAREMPETRPYVLKVQDLENEIRVYDRKIQNIEELYLKGREAYKKKLKSCNKMTKSGKSPGYDVMQKQWEKRRIRESQK